MDLLVHSPLNPKSPKPFGPSRKSGRSRLRSTAAAPYAAAVMILAKRRQECCAWLLAGLGREELVFCGHGRQPVRPLLITGVDPGSSKAVQGRASQSWA